MHRVIRLVTAGFASAFVFGKIYHLAAQNWGATDRERTIRLPGDDLVPDPASVSTMAISINATPDDVWPWLVQMGVDRAGFYTHLWVENGLLHLGVHNAERIVPEWQDLAVGDRVRYAQPHPKRPDIGPIVTAIDPGRALIMGQGSAEPWWGTWQFVLEPIGAHRCRLVLRTRGARHQPLAMTAFNLLLEPGYTYMSIGMLRGIAERAERTTARSAARFDRPVAAITVAARHEASRRRHIYPDTLLEPLRPVPH